MSQQKGLVQNTYFKRGLKHQHIFLNEPNDILTNYVFVKDNDVIMSYIGNQLRLSNFRLINQILENKVIFESSQVCHT